MSIEEIEKDLEEAIEYWENKNESETDFFKCLLEISRNHDINGHKYVYAILEDYERDEYGNELARIILYKK